VVIPYVPPLARPLGFTPLPVSFLLILVAFVIVYLTLAELGKAYFFRTAPRGWPRLARLRTAEHRRVQKIASRWSRPALVVGEIARMGPTPVERRP